MKANFYLYFLSILIFSSFTAIILVWILDGIFQKPIKHLNKKSYAGKPSRVIHIRNIQNDSSEADVVQLGLPFGRVTNVLVLKGKNQAFLEMFDEVSAAAMVACFNTNPPQVRGRTVYVQFSNHRELKIDQSHSVLVSIFKRFFVKF